MQEENNLKKSIQTKNSVQINKPFIANLYYLFVSFCRNVSLWVVMGIHLLLIFLIILIPAFIGIFQSTIFYATFVSFIAINLLFLLIYSLIFGYNIFLKSKSDESELIILSKPITRNQIIWSRILFTVIIAFIYSLIILLVSLIAFGINSKLNYNCFDGPNDTVINFSIYTFDQFLTCAYFIKDVVIVFGTWFGSFLAFMFLSGFIAILGLSMKSSKSAIAISLTTISLSMFATILIDYSQLPTLFSQNERTNYYEYQTKITNSIYQELSHNKNFYLPFTYTDNNTNFPQTGQYYFNWSAIAQKIIEMNNNSSYTYDYSLVNISDNGCISVNFETILVDNAYSYSKIYRFVKEDIQQECYQKNWTFNPDNGINPTTFNNLINQNFTIYTPQNGSLSSDKYLEYINNVFINQNNTWNELKNILSSRNNNLNGLTFLDYVLPTSSLSFALGFGESLYPMSMSNYYMSTPNPHYIKTNSQWKAEYGFNNETNSKNLSITNKIIGTSNLSPFWAQFIIQLAIISGLYALIWFVYYRRDFN